MTIDEAARALGLLRIVVEGRLVGARWAAKVGHRNLRSRGLVCDRSAVQAGYVEPITEPRRFPGAGVALVEVEVGITPAGLRQLRAMT